MNKVAIAATVLLGLTVSACSKKAKYVDPDAESRVEGTGIESRDVRAVATQMATDLLGSTVMGDGTKPPRIAVLPVENKTRFLIDAEIMTTLITDSLISDAGGRLAIVNRELIDQILAEREMKARGQVSSDGQMAALAGVDWFLDGSVESLSASTNRAQTDYVVIRFQATHAESGIVAWSSRYEMKKEGSWGVMYQ